MEWPSTLNAPERACKIKTEKVHGIGDMEVSVGLNWGGMCGAGLRQGRVGSD